jgi:glycosyltransferase involved in cell wall biosynthesis
MHDITSLTYGGYLGFANPSIKKVNEIDFKITTRALVKQYGIKVMPFRNNIIKRMLRQVNRIVAVSSIQERVLNANGIFNTTVIHPGVERACFPPAPHHSKSWDNEFRILFAGRATIGKGLIPLLEVARTLKATNRRFQLKITALREGELAALLDRQYFDLSDRIFCEGWLDKASLSRLYSDCDILISPSVAFEAFCLVNLEAGLHGIPVISSIYGGPVDYIIDGYNGYLVNPVDTNCLTDRVLRLMNDVNLVRTMGANNRIRACEFSLDRTIDRYESLLFDSSETQKQVSL